MKSQVKFAIAMVALLSGTSAFAQTAAWRVSEASGRVVIRDASGDHAAQRGSVVPAGATILTAGSSRAVVVRGEDFVTVSANSRLRVPAAEQSAGLFQMIQEWGNAIFKVKHLPNPHFAVQTPYLAAVVKGTTFSITVTNEGSSVQVLEGAVEAATVDGGAHDLVRPGMVAMVSAGDSLRLSMHGQDSHVIDSPARVEPQAPAASDTKTSSMEASTVVPAAASNAATAGNDDITWSQVSTSIIATPISARPVDLGPVTDGMVGGSSGATLVAAVSGKGAHDGNSGAAGVEVSPDPGNSGGKDKGNSGGTSKGNANGHDKGDDSAVAASVATGSNGADAGIAIASVADVGVSVVTGNSSNGNGNGQGKGNGKGNDKPGKDSGETVAAAINTGSSATSVTTSVGDTASVGVSLAASGGGDQGNGKDKGNGNGNGKGNDKPGKDSGETVAAAINTGSSATSVTTSVGDTASVGVSLAASGGGDQGNGKDKGNGGGNGNGNANGHDKGDDSTVAATIVAGNSGTNVGTSVPSTADVGISVVTGNSGNGNGNGNGKSAGIGAAADVGAIASTAVAANVVSGSDVGVGATVLGVDTGLTLGSGNNGNGKGNGNGNGKAKAAE